MELPNLARLVYRNVKVNTDVGTLIFLVGLPALYLVFFGFGFQSFASAGSAPNSYIIFLTPGIMSFQTIMAGTVGGSMLWADRRWGMLAQLLVGPFTRLQYLLGIMFTTVMFGLAGAMVMLAGSYLLTGVTSISALGGLAVLVALLIGSIFFGSLMLLISALVKSNNAYNSIQVLVIFVVNFASPVFYPLSSGLPIPIRALFMVNPLTYVVNVVRDGYNGAVGMGDVYQLVGLSVLTAAALFIAVRAYMRSDVSYT